MRNIIKLKTQLMCAYPKIVLGSHVAMAGKIESIIIRNTCIAIKGITPPYISMVLMDSGAIKAGDPPLSLTILARPPSIWVA